ncbi:hypothetical protein DFH29DRAFT_925194 [Suillus ampliporus]|nr:hypothetical protein DFH29DRAFT_925194 [Suillus ampliporus]
MAFAAQATKSPFATLLKRSKFSSFDPRIAQVYTTHGGDAHRGNWGFKRPLPIRRRGAYITLKAVDTLEQQTEWNSAEPQAMWMKNWDELQLNPAPEESGTADMVDSEYVPERTDPISWRPSAIPNIHAMSNSEFKQYVAHIRRKRRGFLSYQEKKMESDMSKESSKEKKALPRKLPVELSLEDFAMWESQKLREDRRSRSLESVPHRSAALQTYLSTKEHKGRLVEEVKGDRGKPLYYVASYAGMGTVVHQKNKGVGPVMSWGDVSKTGAMKFRPESASLERAPEVVYKRQGLKAAKISMQAFASDAQSHSQSNTHRPGSLKYITAEPLKPFSNYNAAHPKRSARFNDIVQKSTQPRPPTQSTLDFLRGIVGGDGKGGEEKS